MQLKLKAIVSNSKNGKSAINYFILEGSKFQVRTWAELILLNPKHFQLF